MTAEIHVLGNPQRYPTQGGDTSLFDPTANAVFEDPPRDEVMNRTMEMVTRPPHYTSHPSGIECWQITQHMNFLLGSAMKYLWRVDLKGDPIENIDKAIACLKKEKSRRTGSAGELAEGGC